MTNISEASFVLIAVYLVPYIIAAVMPGWKSLGVIVAITVVYGGWLYGFKESAHSLAVVLDNILYGLAFWGLATGVVFRGVTLTLRQRGVPRWALIVIGVIGAALGPVLFFVIEG